MNKIKNYLLAGILVWLPIGLTLWVLNLIITFVDQFVPSQLSSQAIFGAKIPGTGLFFTILVLFVTGIFTKNFLGQKFIELWDKFVLHIPIVKSLYKGIKQVSDTLFSGSGHAFRKALLIKFPHNDAWTIAFITGTPSSQVIGNDSNRNYVNVYVPTTPNPTSGYFLIVHKDNTRELDMTVDEALRYVISMGSLDSKSRNTADNK
jgi:uncharacterized membrane protein